MKVYLVGGAVRDQLLGLPITERDWVVVGATPEQMITQGFRPVGKDFPVFLHPKTNEEYALARTERKSGRGYQGFVFNTSPEVTLEQDLIRRDMTINAIAQTAEGELIDPYGGVTDIKNRVLRHISEAFVEDPVRVLRVARFVARFEKFHFKVAPETMQLMKHMVDNGEVAHLVAERVWQELHKALLEQHPSQFFHVLQACAAAKVIFPELQVNKESLAALDEIAAITASAKIRFAKFLQQACELAVIKSFCDRLRVPKDYKELAVLVAQYQTQYHALASLDAEKIVDLLAKVDAYRREERFLEFLTACQLPQQQYQQWQQAYVMAKAVPVQPLLASGLTGLALAEALRQARVKQLQLDAHNR